MGWRITEIVLEEREVNNRAKLDCTAHVLNSRVSIVTLHLCYVRKVLLKLILLPLPSFLLKMKLYTNHKVQLALSLTL